MIFLINGLIVYRATRGLLVYSGSTSTPARNQSQVEKRYFLCVCVFFYT